MITRVTNPWTVDDEKKHIGSSIEWWGIEAFFVSTQNKKRWSFKGSCTEWLKKSNQTGSNTIFTLFDIEKNDFKSYYKKNESKKLQANTNIFAVQFDNNRMNGKYPTYNFSFHNPISDIILNLKYHAESLPHWIAQDITNGWLPMGPGLFRYGFIPRCSVEGALIIDERKYIVNGKGYFEHVYGNFSYTNPLRYATQLRKTFSTYAKIIVWWLYQRRPKFPKSLVLSTDNNPMGYDWVWGLFDNGWSLFYGNSLFWITRGPIAGSVILTKDGKHYTEFSHAHFKYLNTKYVQSYDFYYPTEIVIKARNEQEILYLHCTMTTKCHEFYMELTDRKNAFFICEAPGKIEGYYSDGNSKITLNGICKMEPQRQISKWGHNVIGFNFTLPPKGFGIETQFVSHPLKKQIKKIIRFIPRPNVTLNIRKIK